MCDPHMEEKEKKMQANYKKLMNFYRNRIVPTYKEIDEYIDDFKKIYDSIVAPYENLDDDYVSKIGKSAVAFTPEVTISESEIEKAKVPRGDELTNTVYHFEYARKVMGNLPAIKR